MALDTDAMTPHWGDCNYTEKGGALARPRLLAKAPQLGKLTKKHAQWPLGHTCPPNRSPVPEAQTGHHGPLPCDPACLGNSHTMPSKLPHLNSALYCDP